MSRPIASAADFDLVVIGDGPAGSALAAAAGSLGVDVALLGPDRVWDATYGLWVDEVEQTAVWSQLGPSMFVSIDSDVVAFGSTRHRLDRRYGLLDNELVRSHLRRGVDAVVAMASGVAVSRDGVDIAVGTESIRARWVVDATGSASGVLARADAPAHVPTRSTAWQTAYGVVLEDLPASAVIEHHHTTLMDFRPVHPEGSAPLGRTPTFCYVVRVADGWLVEETVLSASPAQDPDLLRDRLVARLGGDRSMLDAARRTERVEIAMNRPMSPSGPRLSVFGASAGYVHPATGFSVAASLRAAERVAKSLAAAIEGGPDPQRVIWSAPMRRTRQLHRYGAAVLAGLDPDGTRAFFDVFFDQPWQRWAPYLQIDARPTQVMSTMAALFAAAPWSLRRRLVTVDPRRWLR